MTSMVERTKRRIRIALLSPCGWGNLGDAAIVEAATYHIHSRVPDADIVAFTLRPEDTKKRHGIPAYPIGASSLAGYAIVHGASGGLVRKLLSTLKPISWRLYCFMSWIVNAVTFAPRELWHWWSVYCWLRNCRLVMVCGGGQLDEFWGGPWGHPYSMFKFACLSRVRGARFAVVSSGSATLKSGLGRWFIRQALRLADYRSFREEFAVRLARELGSPEPNCWCPDLAFSLRTNPSPEREPNTSLVVGISPIAWCDPRVWPEPNSATYARYLGQLAAFTLLVLERGWQVVCFATDGPDHAAIQDLVDSVRQRQIPDLERRMTVSSARTVTDVLSLLEEVDVVVASRLHGVILSYVKHVPALVLSYDPKVDYLVCKFGQTSASLPIDSFDTQDLIARLDQVVTNGTEVSGQLLATIAEWQSPLNAQYDELFGPPISATAPKQRNCAHSELKAAAG